jgi:hypothetical protein
LPLSAQSQCAPVPVGQSRCLVSSLSELAYIAPHVLAPSWRDEEPEPWREEALARLKSLNAQSVRAYQVIELPRSPQDPPEGTLHLALGPYSRRGSWWDHATTYLSNAIEQADQRGDLADSSWKSVFTG